jgi:hypothetical protein
LSNGAKDAYGASMKTVHRSHASRRVRFAWLAATLLGVASGLLAGTGAVGAQLRAATPATSSGATVWLCRPGMGDDPCEASLAATSLSANGSTAAVTTPPNSGSKVDCFYIYPTVSTQTTTNANLVIGKAEIDAAVAQASRFSSLCQVWAPMYRQVTLAGLAAGFSASSATNAAAYSIAYQSLLSGWKDFLANDSDGRPFVLLGHSQGSAMLIDLIRSQIDDNATLRARLVSAIILGGNVQVPTGKLVGGSFQHVAACTSASSTGCVIAYSSFPTEPPMTALFGRAGQGASLQSAQTTKTGQQVLCTNPAALSGGSAALAPYFLTETQQLSHDVATPWVEYPNLYRATCESAGGASWLNVTAATSSSDHRPRVAVTPSAVWGYHENDVNLALGNLLQDVASEERSYAKTAH